MENTLAALGQRLDALHEIADTPITARRPWLHTWLAHYPAMSPHVAVVEGAGGTLVAAAPLVLRRSRGVTRVLAMGDGPSDAARLPTTGPAEAVLLAAAITDWLHDLGHPWLMVLRNLAMDEHGVDALVDKLPWSQVFPGAVSPQLHFRPDRSLRTHVSRNHHQQVRRMHNRLARQGLRPEVRLLRTPSEIAERWDDVERVWRLRDRQLGRRSSLDDPSFGGFVRAVVPVLAGRDEVRLTTLSLSSRLVAYVLCFQDGSVQRMWNCRFDPELAAFGVGRLANNAALEAALADPGCTAFDWMIGEESYKGAMSNTSVQAVDLLACSHRSMWAGVLAARHAAQAYHRRRAGDSHLARALASAAPVLRRLDPTR